MELKQLRATIQIYLYREAFLHTVLGMELKKENKKKYIMGPKLQSH